MRNPLLVPDLRELIHAGEEDVIREFLCDHHPAQVAEIIEDFPVDEGDKLLGILSPTDSRRGAQLSRLRASGPNRRVDGAGRRGVAAAHDVARRTGRPRQEARRRTRRPDSSAPRPGRARRHPPTRQLRTRHRRRGDDDRLCYPSAAFDRQEAIEHLRHAAPNSETIYYNYVVDSQRKLIGFVSLKKLMLARPSARVEDIMHARCDRRPR